MISRTVRVLVATAAVCAVTATAHASDDAYSSRQWAVQKVGAEKAWSKGTGKGVTIAVIDTGVDTRHEDLAGAFVPGHDFVSDDDDPSDEQGHGTHVAGIAAARANNGIGVAGVAPGARIMPVRVLDSEGTGSFNDIDAGVHWAVDHGADVVNLSLSDGAIEEAITGGSLSSSVDYAWSKGVIPVIAAGNGSLFRTEFQGAHTLIVTATGPDDSKPAYATSVGFARWGIAAPGGTDSDGKASMVYSTLWDPKGKSHYGWAMGTSMAAPHVAGAAAILRGLGLSPQQTVDRLLATAEDIGSDFDFGGGRLDVAAAVAGLEPANGAKAAPKEEIKRSAPTSRKRPAALSSRSGSDAPERTPGASASVVVEQSSPVPRALERGEPSSAAGRSWGLVAIGLAAAAASASGLALYQRRSRRAR